MAVYCSQCGREHPDDANFCMMCGKAFKATSMPTTSPSPLFRWEYKDLVVPLNFTEQNHGGFVAPQAAPRANEIILPCLQRAGQEGWQTDGPTDFVELYRAGHVNHKETEGFLGIESMTFISATIRLKRLVGG